MSSTEPSADGGGGTARSHGSWLRLLGPGLAVAATGVGARARHAAKHAGAPVGENLLGVRAVGARHNFALKEGVARWQLATATTGIEGWGPHIRLSIQIG